MELFAPHTRAWFGKTFAAPTAVQTQGWQHIAAGEHALLIAPTGSGKTLAAFLWCIDQITRQLTRQPGVPGVQVVYVSPLKALAHDIERNLHAPIAGIFAAARELGAAVTMPRVAVRTGDTTARERRVQAKQPAEILVTTPESLYLILGSQARETLRSVHTVIIDEAHALAPTKRGAHLALSLERLARLTRRDPQRIGLSATARPLSEVARFVGGDRPVAIVDAGARPAMDLQITVPVADMTRPPAAGNGTGLLTGIWPAIHEELLALIRSHRSTIVFVNSRGLCERITNQMNELAGEELVRAHHGSVSHDERKHIEETLKAGRLAGIVATSSLELGIDMDAVDLVVMVESPGSAARGLQRIGRAGHGVGQVSRGRMVPKHRGDLLEATVVAAAMRRGDIEPLRLPQNPLDVLAQQIVAAVALEPWSVDELGAMARRAGSFAELPASALAAVLDMLAGRYPSTDFASLSPRVVWDRQTDTVTGRRGARMLALVSGGTIPDRGLYAVVLGDGGPRVGELDEEMVHETQAGDLFTLGASTWRVEEITRDRVIVSPAPGEAGALPFWRGDGPGRPVHLGRQVGALVAELDQRLTASGNGGAVKEWLEEEYLLDAAAAQNLVEYVAEQRRVTGTVPTDRRITIERFCDEIGDVRVCILSPLGARVHAPWALALQARLTADTGFAVKTMWSDDGIVLRFAGDELGDAEGRPARVDAERLIPGPAEVEELVLAELGGSSLFAGQFRENAARALLLPRARPGQRTPLWMQRLRSQNLLAVAQQFPGFPMVMETYRSCLQDVFDVPALVDVCRAVAAGEILVDVVDTAAASPFARSLVFAYVAANLYEADAPLAERRARALALDRELLRELLGQEALGELLDAEVLAELHAELQWLSPERRARHAGAVHDMLRRLGDLSEAEVAARCAGDAEAMLAELLASRRAVVMDFAGQARWVAMEDVALYCRGLGVAVPDGVPEALLLDSGDASGAARGAADALVELMGRWCRTQGPFAAAELLARFAVDRGRAALDVLLGRGQVIEGAFCPGAGRELCDAEVFGRLKRRTLARLRRQVAAVEVSRLGQFLPAWHQVLAPAPGRARLQEAIIQLEGLPLPFAELERVILPARVKDFAPRMLDELGAMGWLVWVGHGALGARDGRVALFRRDRVAALHAPAALPGAPGDGADSAVPGDEPDAAAELGPVHRAIVGHLAERGASFFVALQGACGQATTAEVMAALWDLVWAGHVTNDTLQPLRAYGRGLLKAADAPRSSRRGVGRAVMQVAGGRWSLVRELVSQAPPVSATERAHARAVSALERHGIVSREVAAIEPWPGGFAAVYPVLKAMEEAGAVRRGYFVEGLGGAQFAYPGAIDRLRAATSGSGDAVVLSAVDPANPYGWLVPWPDSGSGDAAGAASLRRVPGAAVVLVSGRPVFYIDRSGRSVHSFVDAAERALVGAAVRALDRVAAHKRGKVLRIETVNGEPARLSPLAPLFMEAGFFAEPRGLVRELSLFAPAG